MRLLFITFLFSQSLIGAEVLRVGSNLRLIAISQDTLRQWKVNDRVCVLQNGKPIDCGTVIKSKENYSLVRLKEGSSLISRGDKVVFDVATKKPVVLFQADPITPLSLVPPSPFHLLSIGGSIGPGFFYPSLHFQRIIDPQIALGVMPGYLNITASPKTVSSISLLFTGNFYPSEFFKGLWIQGAIGFAFISSRNGTVEQQATSLEALATVGYQTKLEIGIVVGIAAGVQYLTDPEFTGITLNGVGVKPIVIFNVGVNF